MESAHALRATPGRISNASRVDGGIGAAIADDCAVQHAVTVEEDRPVGLAASRPLAHRTDSHLVARDFSRGCETSRCQTTAWNASEWGVMCSGLTVGTIAQAAATLAV